MNLTAYYRYSNPVTPGTIIHSTMQEGDIIPALLRVVMNHNAKAFREIVGLSPIPPYAMEDARDPWWHTDSALCILDEAVDALSAMAPAGTYFGSHPSDSSDLGFWTLEH